jgi:predicted metalloendopeptidase
MRFNIGYPDKWRDYSALKTKKDNLLYNVQQIKIFNYNRNISKLFKPVDKNEWDGVPQDTNAYYTPTENKFVLLAGILNKPFFDLKGGYEVSYGGIGFIISHEIGHAFDDAGSLFDGNGNMKNWWSKSDHKKFDILKKKLIAQANNYEIMPGKYENGNLEVGEIIADLSGIEIVKRAYLKVALKNNIPRKEALQRFFLQIAKTWRENYRENVMKLIIDTDPHPLGEYRVNGILQNIDEFYEVFDIKKGDKMYLEPSKRVIIW